MAKQRSCSRCDRWSREVAFDAICRRCGRSAHEAIEERRLRGARTRDTPWALRRWPTRLILLLFINNAVVLLSIVAIMRGQLLWAVVAMVASVLILVGFVALLMTHQRRMARRAARANFRLCPRCGYSLDHFQSGIVSCPECGATGELAEIELAWCDACAQFPAWARADRDGSAA